MIHWLDGRNDDEELYDFYWRWEEMVSKQIDRMYENDGLFDNQCVSRYDVAMNEIEEYIYESTIGTRVEMNCHSYVKAVIAIYKMVHKNKFLAGIWSDASFQEAFKKEYRLMSKYYAKLEECDSFITQSFNIFYSAKPMEDNLLTEYRALEREEYCDKFLDVLLRNSVFHANGQRPSDTQVKRHFHKMMPPLLVSRKNLSKSGLYCTDTVGIYFLEWIKLRDSIADQIHPSIAYSIRNQTTNIVIDCKNTEIDTYDYMDF